MAVGLGTAARCLFRKRIRQCVRATGAGTHSCSSSKPELNFDPCRNFRRRQETEANATPQSLLLQQAGGIN